MQRSAKRQRKEGGFTLIELIVVCTLIGIMLTLGIPSLRNSIYTDPLKSSARKVIGFIGGVRELAVRHQQPYLVHISQVENRIWYEKDVDKVAESKAIKDDPADDESQTGDLQLAEAIRISEVATSESEESAEEKATVWISKEGYLVPTSVRLEDEDGNILNVQFYPFLDSATVSDNKS